jgi:uncharacterized membrane protein YfcA
MLSIAIVTVAFLLASFVKGMVGLGLPLVALGLLALVMTPAEAAALLVVPSMVTNVWQLVAGPNFSALTRRLWSMMLAIVLSTWITAWAGGAMLIGPDARLAAGALGVALFVYAILSLTAFRFTAPKHWEPWLSPLIGAMTGAVAAATGVFAVPAVPYFQALHLDKEELVQTLGLSFTVSTLALALVLAKSGILRLDTAGASLLVLIPTALGMLAGQWLRQRVSEQLFRKLFLVGLAGLGLYLATNLAAAFTP